MPSRAGVGRGLPAVTVAEFGQRSRDIRERADTGPGKADEQGDETELPWTSSRTRTPMASASTSPAGDEVYGSWTRLREFFEERGQAYVLRVASSFLLMLAPGTRMTCADAVKKLLDDKKKWEVRRHPLGRVDPPPPSPRPLVPQTRQARSPAIQRSCRSGSEMRVPY
ncbi:MAG TPA: hypothetical protein VF070_26650 [Streptosporangiaceae bacterium]